MRPTAPVADDAAVALLRQQVPEFEDLYRDLLDIYDEDLTAAIVFMELADFVADLMIHHEHEELLERTLEVVERVVAGSSSGGQLVRESFLAELSVLTTERLRPMLGPATVELLDSTGAPGGFTP